MLHLSLFCNFHNKSKFEIEKEEKNEPQKPTELYTRPEFYQNKPSYISKLDLSDITERVQYNTFIQILDTIRNLEHACRKFDIPGNYPWR
jgi:hypothetical protein